MKLELLALKWAVAEKFREYLLGSEFVVYTDNNPADLPQSKSKLKAVEQRWAAELASFNFKIEYRAGKHNTNADALSRVSWEAACKSAKHRDDADTDDDEHSTHVAETLAAIADMTRLPERVQLGLLEDAIHVEELGVTTPADQCAEQATCLSFILRDQITMLQQKDATILRLKHYLNLGRKPNRQERKQETRETLQLVGYLDSIAEKDGLLFRTVRNNDDQLKRLLVVPSVLHGEVLKAAHNDFGHQGPERTEQVVQR